MKCNLIYICVSAALVTSCATKRYPMAVNLSPEEVAVMDCKDLYLEEARISQARSQIDDIAGTDWRSIAGFLGDYGIGNAMAKSEAEKALRERAQGIRTTKAQKNCGTDAIANSDGEGNPTRTSAELKLAYYDANIVGVIFPDGEIRSFAHGKMIKVPSGVNGREIVDPVTRDGRLIGVATKDGVVFPLSGEVFITSAAAAK